VAARQQWSLIVTRSHGDSAATQILEGLSGELTASEIMHAYGLTRWEYQQATLRIRRRMRDIEQERRREL
jgi:hypothetical protein